MRGMKRKLILTLAIVVGSLIGTFKGEVAKQKYLSRMKNRYDQKQVRQQPEIVLDEFEFSAFHSS